MAACFDRSVVITVISQFLSSKLSISVVRDNQVINLSSGSLGWEWNIGRGGSPQLPSHLFWWSHPSSSGRKERLFLLSSTVPVCLRQNTHWWCLNDASSLGILLKSCPFVSLYFTDNFEFSQICFFFFTGRLRVASPCLWLIVLIAAVMNCVGTYWEIEKYPLYSMVFLILEMHKRCQVSAHFKFHWDWIFRHHL